jgi:hypothetical protein
MVNPNRFYTYAYLREDRTPYYIGKGEGKRLHTKNKGEIGKPTDKSRIIFLKQNLTEEEAFGHEIYMIAVFGRKDLGTGILRNRTNGGKGSSGIIISDQTKQKLKKRNKKNNIIPPSQIGKKWWNNGLENKMSVNSPGTKWVKGRLEFHKGHEVLIETRIKISLKNSGKKRTEEFKIYLSEINKGKKWWTNGVKNKRCFECPGIEWKPGRILYKLAKELQDEMERKSKPPNDDSTTFK